MKIQHRQDIVGKRIANILQTEPKVIDDFSDRRIFVTLHDGAIFELASQNPETCPSLILPDIEYGALQPLEEGDGLVEHCRSSAIREVCYAYFTPDIFVLLDGDRFLWVACGEYGLYVNVSPADSEDIDLEKTFTFWGHKRLDLAKLE